MTFCDNYLQINNKNRVTFYEYNGNKTMKNLIHKIQYMALVLLCVGSLFASDWERLVNLRGYWEFTIGDDMKWADPDYDDSSWEEIKVPSSWESEGFHGYNGYAWYRTSFNLPRGAQNFSLHLYMGYIDDVDEVYVNGNLVGESGSFPPNYSTAYSAKRSYPLPQKFLRTDGRNIIAVRVYDSQLSGGIVSGDIGIYAYSNGMSLDVNLEGEWKFRTGDEEDWKDPNYNDNHWESIFVPGTWETRGWPNYNGIAWYRLKFFLPADYKDDKLILVLGKIDDVDETYLNGTKIGSTGDIYAAEKYGQFSQEYSQLRGYYIPDSLLKPGKENVIAVRVYDGYRDGGIYEGPIGLITQSEYRKYWKNKKEGKNIWDLLFDN